MATFTYTEDAPVRKNTKPKVIITKLGEGYEQRQGDGINLLPRTWALTFSLRQKTEADGIENFFRARYGVESFDWTPSGEITVVRVKVADWNRDLFPADISSITCVFEEVFEPSI